MKHSYEAAFNFLCHRMPHLFNFSQIQWVQLLMEYEEKKGTEAIKALAGFYIFAIDKIKGEKASNAIAETFCHDIADRNCPTSLPRSSEYVKFWEQEHEKYCRNH